MYKAQRIWRKWGCHSFWTHCCLPDSVVTFKALVSFQLPRWLNGQIEQFKILKVFPHRHSTNRWRIVGCSFQHLEDCCIGNYFLVFHHLWEMTPFWGGIYSMAIFWYLEQRSEVFKCSVLRSIAHQSPNDKLIGPNSACLHSRMISELTPSPHI